MKQLRSLDKTIASHEDAAKKTRDKINTHDMDIAREKERITEWQAKVDGVSSNVAAKKRKLAKLDSEKELRTANLKALQNKCVDKKKLPIPFRNFTPVCPCPRR